MHAIGATVPREASHPESLSPLIQGWRTYIRAMEDHYAAPVQHTPAEALAAATWAARLHMHPPVVPATRDPGLRRSRCSAVPPASSASSSPSS